MAPDRGHFSSISAMDRVFLGRRAIFPIDPTSDILSGHINRRSTVAESSTIVQEVRRQGTNEISRVLVSILELVPSVSR